MQTLINTYDGGALAYNIGAFGCDVFFERHTVAPSAVVYFFKPINYADYTERKARAAVQRLGLQLGQAVTFTPTPSGFSVSIPRENRRFIKLWDCAAPLEQHAPRVYIPLGIDDDGNARAVALDDCPHLLIAGASGSGKTSYLHAIIGGLACYSHAGIMLIDVKAVEFPRWERSPHLVAPIITNARSAAGYLRGAVNEMMRRYDALKRQGLRDNSAGTFSPLVIIIDEFADLVLSNRADIEPLIIKIAQMGRAAGVHLILATQRPTVNVLSGLILANIPARVCLSVASVRDSVVMLDHKGGEELRGKGDALVKLANGEEFHAQAPYLTADDIDAIESTCPPHPKFRENGEEWDKPKKPKRRGLWQRVKAFFSGTSTTTDDMIDYDMMDDDDD